MALDFDIKQAAAIGIIGGADGPTAIFVAGKLAPELLGAIAIAAYSYMALVPIIQPPIMRALTTEQRAKNRNGAITRGVSTREDCFSLIVTPSCGAPFAFSGTITRNVLFWKSDERMCVVDRLTDTTQNALINIVTIFLGLGVGSKLSSEAFLNIETLGILFLGMGAFAIGTASGVLMAKLMNIASSTPINPLIGAAGVSAVPMASRVANKVGLESNPQNFLLMHAMGPNVAGVIGSAVAAGVLIQFAGG